MTTRSTLRHDIARIVEGPDFITGTADSNATATQLIDAEELLAANDTYKGRYVYIYYDAAGAGAAPQGQERRITASTAADKLITFAATTAAVTTGDLYEIHTKGLRVADYNEAINAAYRAARRSHLLRKVDESLMFSNLLLNGCLELWTSAVADNWTLGGTGAAQAQETSLIWTKKYAAKLTNQASQELTFSQAIANFARYRGQPATLKAWVQCATASRVRIRLADGVNTWNSDYHDGKGWPGSADDPLEIESKTLSDNATQLTASLRIETGTSISAYLGRIELSCASVDVGADYIYEYSIPSSFVVLSQVWRESGTHNEYNFLIPGKWWSIKPDSTRKLVFRPDFFTPTSGYRMMLVGQTKATEPTADTSTIELNEEYVKAYAIWQLLLRDQSTEAQRAQGIYWGSLAQQLLRRLSVPLDTNGRMVEPI